MSLMVEEIEEQPAALERTLRAERKHAQQFAARLRKKPLPLIVLVARGTSDNAAQFGRYLFEITTRIPVSLAAPSVHTLYKTPLRLRDTLVIGISQSGESTDINLVLENSKQRGAIVAAITNEPHSTMAKIADEVFLTRAGREHSVAATKTYTTQLLMLYLLAEALAEGGTFAEIPRLPALAAASLKLRPHIRELVEQFRRMQRCIVVGRGLNYANAFEFSIKLMETCYVVAERFSSADFLHGPIAVVEQQFPVFLFAPPGKVFRDLVTLAQRLKKLHAQTTVISSERAICRLADSSICIREKIDDLFSPIPYIIPAQLFAALLAEAKGLSPDRPRSLKKITRTI